MAGPDPQMQRRIDDALDAFNDPDASPERLRAALGAALVSCAELYEKIGDLLLSRANA